MEKKAKKEDYARPNTKRVCVKLTDEQHQFLIQRGQVFGKFGMSEALRQILDREMGVNK